LNFLLNFSMVSCLNF